MSSVVLWTGTTTDGKRRVVAEWHKDVAPTVSVYQPLTADNQYWARLSSRSLAGTQAAEKTAKRTLARLNKEIR